MTFSISIQISIFFKIANLKKIEILYIRVCEFVVCCLLRYESKIVNEQTSVTLVLSIIWTDKHIAAHENTHNILGRPSLFGGRNAELSLLQYRTYCGSKFKREDLNLYLILCTINNSRVDNIICRHWSQRSKDESRSNITNFLIFQRSNLSFDSLLDASNFKWHLKRRLGWGVIEL